jgi:GAF domain-containing protein
MLFTSQAAAALEMMKATKQAEELDSLRQTSLIITSSLDRSVILDTIIKQAVQLFKAANGGIYAYYPDQGKLVLRGNYKRPTAIGRTLQVGEGICGQLIQTHEPYIIVDDYYTWPKRSPQFSANENSFGAVVAVPLKWQGQIRGVLFLADQVERRFTQEEAHLLSLFADQAAIALTNADLIAQQHESTESRRKLLEALVEKSQNIQADKGESDIFQQVVRLVPDMVGSTVAALFKSFPHLRQLELKSCYGFDDALIGSLLSHDDGLIGNVARTGKAEIRYNYSEWPDRESLFASYNFQTVIGVPFNQNGEVEEVLFVAYTIGQQPSIEICLEILQLFANYVCIALRTSRLLDPKQQTLRSLPILRKISDYIQIENNLEKIIHVVLTGVTAGFGLGFNRAALFLLDQQKEHLVGCLGIGHLVE